MKKLKRDVLTIYLQTPFRHVVRVRRQAFKDERALVVKMPTTFPRHQLRGFMHLEDLLVTTEKCYVRSCKSAINIVYLFSLATLRVKSFAFFLIISESIV